jgi:hypothetical protein
MCTRTGPEPDQSDRNADTLAGKNLPYPAFQKNLVRPGRPKIPRRAGSRDTTT